MAKAKQDKISTNSEPKEGLHNMAIGQPLKFGTPEKRKEMWAALCKHVEDGFSMQSFPLCDEDTFYSYAKRFPEDCPMEMFRDSKRKGLMFWEGLGKQGVCGTIQGFSASAWIFNMKNRAGWTDKTENRNVDENGKTVPLTPATIQVIHVKAEDPRDKGSDT